MLGKALLLGVLVFVVVLVAFAMIGTSEPTAKHIYNQMNAVNPNQEIENKGITHNDYGWIMFIWRRTWTDPIALFTFMLAIFTFLLTISTVLLYISSEKVANTSKDALLSVQRAFIFVDSIQAFVLNDSFVIIPSWINSGSTPENPFTNWANWKVFSAELPADFDYPDVDKNGQPITGGAKGPIMFMGPHARQGTEPLKVPIPVMDEVRAGKLRLFIYGWAEYRDAFQGTSGHRTEFCNEISVTDMGKDNTTGKTTVAIITNIYGPRNTAR
jgi:hypothetical protein